MKSDIIYKIGTAEFRKRYINPAIKSGKISYDYKIRWGTQAFREKYMEIVLGEDNEEPTEPTTPIDASKISYSLEKDSSFQYWMRQDEDNGVILLFRINKEVPVINRQGEAVIPSFNDKINIILKKGFMQTDKANDIIIRVESDFEHQYLEKAKDCIVQYEYQPDEDYEFYKEDSFADDLSYTNMDLGKEFVEADADILTITPNWQYYMQSDLDIEDLPEGESTTTRIYGGVGIVIQLYSPV